MNRPLIAVIAATIIASGCSVAASPEPVVQLAVPVSTLPPTTERSVPTTEPPAPVTTTVPPDTEPPTIETTINSGAIVDWYRGHITVSTEVDAELTIDRKTVDLDSEGSVTVPIVNAPGDNSITITATDDAGNTAMGSVVYTFDPPEGWIATLGDSIMRGAEEEIERRLGIDIVNATVSRQFLEAPALVADLVRRANRPQVVVIGLGTNGPVQTRHFDEVMEILGPETLVAFINVRVPRSWEATSNNELVAGVERHDNAILIDWFAMADDRDELFRGDGYHPSEQGKVVLSDMIADAILRKPEPQEPSGPAVPILLM